MGGRRRRRRIEPNEDWEQLALLCRWPEQLAYEEIRPLTLFGSPVVERARSGYPNGELALGVRGAERPERIRRLVELVGPLDGLRERPGLEQLREPT